MTDELLKQPIIWIDSLDALEAACDRWFEKKILAIDTEFMRSNTYYPIAGLIQINDGEANYLIDPTVIQDLSPLAEILGSDDITIAIHSCSEDLDVFDRALGCLPTHLFDTQIAGAICGLGFSVGFASMVQKTLDVALPKTQTRSDWLARPLSAAQTKYAAMDVEYLYALTHQLIHDLTQQGRLDWAFIESKQLVKNVANQFTPENSYLRYKQAYKLNTEQLYVFKCLCEWREELAQIKDKPRNHLIKENVLFFIAQVQPSHVAQLRNIEGVSDRFIKKYGEKIITITEKALSLCAQAKPLPAPRPLSSSALTLVKKLRATVNEYALQNNIAPELLMKKKDYEYIVTCFQQEGKIVFPVTMPAWRLGQVKALIENQLKAENV